MSYPTQIPTLLINTTLILTVKLFTVSLTLITIASILQIRFLTKNAGLRVQDFHIPQKKQMEEAGRGERK